MSTRGAHTRNVKERGGRWSWVEVVKEERWSWAHARKVEVEEEQRWSWAHARKVDGNAPCHDRGPRPYQDLEETHRSFAALVEPVAG